MRYDIDLMRILAQTRRRDKKTSREWYGGSLRLKPGDKGYSGPFGDVTWSLWNQR